MRQLIAAVISPNTEINFDKNESAIFVDSDTECQVIAPVESPAGNILCTEMYNYYNTGLDKRVGVHFTPFCLIFSGVTVVTFQQLKLGTYAVLEWPDRDGYINAFVYIQYSQLGVGERKTCGEHQGIKMSLITLQAWELSLHMIQLNLSFNN